MSDAAQELKKKISYYTSFGNNLKPFLGEQQLKDLKGILEQLKGTISEKEWSKLMGRSYNCFIKEIDFKIAEWQHGTHPIQGKPTITTPSTEKPAQSTQPTTPEQPKPTDSTSTTPSNSTTTTPADTPTSTAPTTPDTSRPTTPEPIKPKPTTPEELETAKYNKLLKDIKNETDPEKLKDGGEYSQKIDALDYKLLTLEKQPQYLHDARIERRNDLLDKEKEQKWQAWFKQRQILQDSDQKAWRTLKNDQEAEATYKNALAKDGENNNWDPLLTDEEKASINNSKSPGAIKNAQITIKGKRDNTKIASELLEELNNWTELATIPRSQDIKAKYDEALVPDNLKYEVLKEARNTRRKLLFKLAFEGANPSKLTDEQIEAWDIASVKGETGLNGLGINERIAFNNKWEISDIKAGKIAIFKVEPEIITDIDPLAVNKEQLSKALEILNDINDPAKQTFSSLPENYRKAEIDALPQNLPAQANPNKLRERIKERRATFTLSLDRPEDGGLTPKQLTDARELEKGVYVAKGKPPAPADIINQVLRWEMTKDRTPVPKLEWSEPVDLDNWLTSPENRGYRIEDEKDAEIKGKTYTGKEILEQENDKWGNPESPDFDRGKQGRLLLPFFNKKVGFDPDNPEAFLTEAGNSIKGHLPYATGIGKTTKTVCCICKGGTRSIILVLPTESLALSAYGSHNDWLQDYICPIHEIKHGEYNVGLFEVIENGLSILRPGDLLGYLVRNLLIPTKTGFKGVSKSPSDADFEAKVREVKDGRKLKKDKHVILYDEADEANPTYQTIIEESINQGYKCIKMSATFPGVPWSITTTNKINSQKITGLRDEMLVAKDGEPKNIAIFIRETEPRTKGKEIIDPLTAEQKKLLAPYSYVVFDKSNAGAAEGITRGMPRGTLFFVSPIYGRGFTFFIQAVIITNWMQTKKLGGGWIYGEPNTQRLPLPDHGQERGRVGRTEEGDAWWLNNELGSIKGAEDIGTKLTKAVLTGDLSELAKTYGTLTKEGIDFIRAAIAWPDKFGLLPEEILIGLGVGGAGKAKYPLFTGKPPTSYDPDLWDRHMKVVKKSTMPKDTASNILKLMIANLIKRKTKENNFPDNIKVRIESPLIEQVGWSEDPKKNKANIKEVREIINGIIAENIPNPATNTYKDEALFNKVVKLHKLALDLKISIEREETDEWIDKKDHSKGKKKKENLTLLITSGKLADTRKLKSIGDFYSETPQRIAEKL